MATLELVVVGTPVAVKTPVGIVVVAVELLLPLELDCVDDFVDVGGALVMKLEGGTVGLPATLLTLASGACQLAESPYRTPLMRTPARFAIMFFWSVLQVAFTALKWHVGSAAGGALLVCVALISPLVENVERSTGRPRLMPVPAMTLENTVNAVSG